MSAWKAVNDLKEGGLGPLALSLHFPKQGVMQ
jgi:hypothetical protein